MSTSFPIVWLAGSSCHAPFAYTLDCISQDGEIELKTLMAQSATLSVRQADGEYRKLSGLVESAALLGEDGGVFYYQLILVPWLTMLKLGRDSRIFQDMSAVEVIESVFSNHAIAQGDAQGGWRLAAGGWTCAASIRRVATECSIARVTSSSSIV